MTISLTDPFTKSAGASASKCNGFAEFCNPSTPPKYYLQENEITTGWMNEYESGYGEIHAKDSEIYTTTYDYMTCTNASVYSSGNANYFAVVYGYSSTSESDSITNETTGNWSDGGQADSDAIGAAEDAQYYLSNKQCETNTSEYTPTMVDEISDGSTNWGYAEESYDETTTWALSSEFTDEMLRGKMISLIPAYPAGWATNQNSSAYYSLNSSHTTASGGKMEYRFHVTDCVSDPDVSYKVTWTQVTTCENQTGPPEIENMEETIPGSADIVNGVYGSVREVDVPTTPSTITETSVNVSVIQPGNGGN